MGHKNYSKFSGNFNKNNQEEKTEIMNNQITNEETEKVELVVNGEVKIDFPITEGLQENDVVTEEGVIHTEEVPEFVTGVVTGCSKLYVREKASKESKPLCVIDEKTEVQVYCKENESVDFYKVITSAGVEGYCMKKFISIK